MKTENKFEELGKWIDDNEKGKQVTHCYFGESNENNSNNIHFTMKEIIKFIKKQAQQEELEFLESLFLGGYIPSRAMKIKKRISKLKQEQEGGMLS